MDEREAALLGRARGGDARAFASLVEAYWPRLHRWLLAMTRDVQSAEDITQESFLRAWRCLATLRDGAAFRPWLFAIARNGLSDARRGPRGEASVPLPESLAADDPEPLEEVVTQEAMSLIQEECGKLPTHFRAALLLWTQERMPYPELAAALGTTEETARWRVCKARQLLYSRLRPHFGPEAP